MNPRKIKMPYLVVLGILFFSFHFYFLFLTDTDLADLIYLDVLLVLGIGSFLAYDDWCDRRHIQQKERLLEKEELISPLLAPYLDQEVLEHDLTVLRKEIDACYDLDHEKEDEMAKWVHEIKIPLAALGLLCEKVTDLKLRTEIKEQIERINQSLASMLVSLRLTSPVLVVQIKPVSLATCVKTSIKNNQFFLIRNQFEIHLGNLEEVVYTDQQWLIYVLDQLIANAIKYAEDSPYLVFESVRQEKGIALKIIDHGEGIRVEDISRIFEKGYTGMNKHNGMYKSTGMGLYFVHKILTHLGHGIEVTSQIGGPTCFTIHFMDNRDYFNL